MPSRWRQLPSAGSARGVVEIYNVGDNRIRMAAERARNQVVPLAEQVTSLAAQVQGWAENVQGLADPTIAAAAQALQAAADALGLAAGVKDIRQDLRRPTNFYGPKFLLGVRDTLGHLPFYVGEDGLTRAFGLELQGYRAATRNHPAHLFSAIVHGQPGAPDFSPFWVALDGFDAIFAPSAVARLQAAMPFSAIQAASASALSSATLAQAAAAVVAALIRTAQRTSRPDLLFAARDALGRTPFEVETSGISNAWGLRLLPWRNSVHRNHPPHLLTCLVERPGLPSIGTWWIDKDAGFDANFSQSAIAKLGGSLTVPDGLFSGNKLAAPSLQRVIADDEGYEVRYVRRTDRTPPQTVAIPDEPNRRVVGLVHSGQSLSAGSTVGWLESGERAVTTVPPEPHRALRLGAITMRPPDPLDVPEDFEASSEDAAIGESQGTSMMRMLVRAARTAGEEPDTYVYRSVGVGGLTIAELSLGTVPYANGLVAARAMRRQALNYGRAGIYFPASLWTQGEANRGSPFTPRATYSGGLLQYGVDVDRDLRLISRQRERVFVLVDQLAAPNAAEGPDHISLAQLDAVETAGSLVAMCGPKYWLKGDYGYIWDEVLGGSNVHLWPLGYAVLGEQHGKAVRKIMAAQASNPDVMPDQVETCLRPLRSGINRVGNQITIPYRGAIGDLRINETGMPPAPGAGYDHPAGISSVVAEAGAIKINLASSAEGRLTYASVTLDVDPLDGHASSWGNVCDSDPTPSIAKPGLTLTNWAVIHDVANI